jgi:uncharacterized RDD family membrane protein YckC
MPSPGSFLASSQARVLAAATDICAASFLIVPVAVGGYFLDTREPGALEFSIVLFAFHTYFLYFRDGCSVGKYFQNITVAREDGANLKLPQAVLRGALTAAPWFLLGITDLFPPADSADRFGASPLSSLAFAWLIGDLLLIEFTPTRRGVADRFAQTLVIKLPPLQPHRAPAVPMFSANDAEFGNPPKRPRDGP